MAISNTQIQPLVMPYLAMTAPSVQPGISDAAKIQDKGSKNVASDVTAMVAQLGQATRNQTHHGVIQLNEPLVNAIANHGETAIDPLAAFFQRPQHPIALAEGIYTAQKLAEKKTPGIEKLYAPLSRFNTTLNPLVQNYLAGFYRAIDDPVVFGPMLGTLVHHAIYDYPAQANPNDNISEEVGSAILQSIARQTAKETVKELLPYLVAISQPNPTQALPPQINSPIETIHHLSFSA